MIDLANLAKITGAGGTSLLASIGAGYMLFTPQDDFNRYVAESERGFILDTVEKARSVEPGPYKDSLCRTLEESIARLCASASEDAICVDRDEYLTRAGCR